MATGGSAAGSLQVEQVTKAFSKCLTANSATSMHTLMVNSVVKDVKEWKYTLAGIKGV